MLIIIIVYWGPDTIWSSLYALFLLICTASSWYTPYNQPLFFKSRARFSHLMKWPNKGHTAKWWNMDLTQAWIPDALMHSAMHLAFPMMVLKTIIYNFCTYILSSGSSFQCLLSHSFPNLHQKNKNYSQMCTRLIHLIRYINV